MKKYGCVLAMLIACFTGSTMQAQITASLTAVQMVGSNVGYAIGSSGTILNSTDGGVTWASQTSGTSLTLSGESFATASVGWAVGSNSLYGTNVILKTTNGGSNWVPQSSGLAVATLYGVSAANSSVAVIVGKSQYAQGLILRTTDGGSSWSSISGAGPNPLYSACFIDANTVVAVGWAGVVLKSTDGGATWVQKFLSSTDIFMGVRFYGTSTALAVGTTGVIFKSTDGGETWSEKRRTAISTPDLYSVSFTDINTAYVSGASGTILKTSDGGTTWVNLSSGSPYALQGVSFIDANTGIVVGGTATVLRSANSGASWSQQSVGGSGGGTGTTDTTPPVISAVSSSGLTSSGSTITWSTNEGANSTVQFGLTSTYSSMVSNPSIVTAHSLALTGLLPGTTYHYCVKSTDGSGNTSTSGDHSFMTGSVLNYVPGSAPILQGSLSSGSSASLSTIDANYYVLNSTIKGTRVSDWYGSTIVSASAGSIVSVTISYTGKFSRATTQGLYLYNWTSASWTQIDSRSIGTADVTASVRQSSPAAYVSNSGEIRLRVLGTGGSKSFTCSGNNLQISVETAGTILASQESKATGESIHQPESFQLHQNYPNPFNPTTTIQFNVPEPSVVVLAVYNDLGEEIARLYEGQMDAGSRNVSWSAVDRNGNTVPSGVYLYRISATSVQSNKQFTAAKKMMLLK